MTVTTDPWASNDNGPEQPVATTAPATTVVNNSSNVAPGEGKIVTTLKGGRDFDAPWIVIHASSVEESDALLDAKFKDYMDKVKKVAAAFAGGSAAAPSAPAPSRPAVSGSRPAPAGAKEAPEWAPPPPYDDFVYVSKVNQNTGKVWHAWMPPTKDDTRQPKFFYPPR
ncbi:hypothetical protein SEA_CIAO_47 [Mycobacterium phage Ciao]|nr:hypothetical protein EA_SCOWL_48 [Mycobacterium phage Scowl]WNN95905.1 hypothetical protein SEA_CIAO_47 [Mycobacterium phage Ciao]